jgi:hypothetical protein
MNKINIEDLLFLITILLTTIGPVVVCLVSSS